MATTANAAGIALDCQDRIGLKSAPCGDISVKRDAKRHWQRRPKDRSDLEKMPSGEFALNNFTTSLKYIGGN